METPYFMQIMHKNPVVQGGWRSFHMQGKTVTRLKRSATSEEGQWFKNEKDAADIKRDYKKLTYIGSDLHSKEAAHCDVTSVIW